MKEHCIKESMTPGKRQLQIQECKVQGVKASDACSGEKDYSRIVSDNGNVQGLENQNNTSGDKSSRLRNECNDKSNFGDDTDISPSYDTEPMVEVPYTTEYNVFAIDIQHSEQPECIINTCVVDKADSNVTHDSPDMCDNEIHTYHNFVECDDERAALANLIANLKLDIDENKTIQKQLRKANVSLTQELKECKSTLAETSRTLGESNSIRDSCLVALQNKQTKFERYKAFNDRTVDYDKLERKLNETLGLLAQKDIDIKEGLKVKAYKILVVKEKHGELVKQSLLTKSHYEGLVREKSKREQYFEIQDLKAQFQDKDIAIRELKKLIENNKGKGVDTNFEKHQYLGKPAFATNQEINHEEAKKKAQLQKDKALNTKPSVQQSARLPNTANGNKLKPRNFNQQPRNWPPSMSSRVLNRTVNTTEPPRNQKTFLKSK
ncbi:hypothetical protein Tco_0222849 [Tanacetum coccineum]